jgi:hypothetical protein
MRVTALVALGVLVVWVAYLAFAFLTLPNVGPAAGTGDHATYMDAVRRWLAGGSFYQPYQLAGPYTVSKVEILYPPTILPLLAVMSVLPAILWWIVPLGTIAAVVWHWRPSLLGWIGILACLAIPSTWEAIAYGNPVMWIAAFAALGTVYGWPAVLVLLKPTLAPFALIGIRRRSWWVALAGLLAASLLLLPLWAQYVAVLENARGPLVSPLYSLKDVPLMLVPIVAWLSATRSRSRAASPAASGSASPRA